MKTNAEKLQELKALAERWQEYAQDENASNTDKVLGTNADQILEIIGEIELPTDWPKRAAEILAVQRGEAEYVIRDHDIVFVPQSEVDWAVYQELLRP